MSEKIAVLFPDDFYTGLEYIKREYESLTEALSNAEQELKNFRSEDEISRRDAEISRLRSCSLHDMSPKELEKYRAFRKTHYDECGNGRHFVVDLCGTGIGECIEVMCPVCGKKEDITDYETW